VNATLTIPLEAAIEIATANGWTYTEATELNNAIITNADGAIYIADPDDPVQTAHDMGRVLANLMGNAVNTVPYTQVTVEVTV